MCHAGSGDRDLRRYDMALPAIVRIKFTSKI